MPAKTITKPLHGEWIYGMKISNAPEFGGRPTLARRKLASEFGHAERIETAAIPFLPGVKIVWLFSASVPGYDREPPVLAEARLSNPHPITFLLSMARKDLLVATCTFEGKEKGPIVVPDEIDPIMKKYHTLPDLGIGLSAIDESSQSFILSQHNDRLNSAGGTPFPTFRQEAADLAFREMYLRTREAST